MADFVEEQIVRHEWTGNVDNISYVGLLVRCKDCRFDSKCKDRPLKALNDPYWYCAGGVRKEGDGDAD